MQFNLQQINTGWLVRATLKVVTDGAVSTSIEYYAFDTDPEAIAKIKELIDLNR